MKPRLLSLLMILLLLNSCRSPGQPAASSPEVTGPLTVIWQDCTYYGTAEKQPELPEGFLPAGEHNPVGPFFSDTEQLKRKDAGAAPDYQLFVRDWLYTADPVCVNDQLYCRPFSVGYEQGFDSHFSPDRYKELTGVYPSGKSTQLSDGFSLLGIADFTGSNTLPYGTLSANLKTRKSMPIQVIRRCFL